MKAGIHPNYQIARIVCACGATYEVGSTKEAVEVELCSACHPFYTGKQKVVDTARRVEKFQARAGKAEDSQTGHAAKLEKKAQRAKARQEKREAQEKAEA